MSASRYFFWKAALLVHALKPASTEEKAAKGRRGLKVRGDAGGAHRAIERRLNKTPTTFGSSYACSIMTRRMLRNGAEALREALGSSAMPGARASAKADFLGGA
jgi:hypothetical protein